MQEQSPSGTRSGCALLSGLVVSEKHLECREENNQPARQPADRRRPPGPERADPRRHTTAARVILRNGDRLTDRSGLPGARASAEQVRARANGGRRYAGLRTGRGQRPDVAPPLARVPGRSSCSSTARTSARPAPRSPLPRTLAPAAPDLPGRALPAVRTSAELEGARTTAADGNGATSNQRNPARLEDPASHGRSETSRRRRREPPPGETAQESHGDQERQHCEQRRCLFRSCAVPVGSSLPGRRAGPAVVAPEVIHTQPRQTPRERALRPSDCLTHSSPRAALRW